MYAYNLMAQTMLNLLPKGVVEKVSEIPYKPIFPTPMPPLTRRQKLY